MKKLTTLCAAILLMTSVFLPQQASAQTPGMMSYQAVVRDGNDALVATKTVGMQISILQGTSTGTAVYTETQTPTTNANGLVSLQIGAGTTSDDFTSIDWATGPYFIKTETDPSGGTNYSITGTSQLMSVPYALYAKSAERVTDGITETDPVFTAWDKSTGISITESQITDLGIYIETETDPTVIKYSVGDFAQGGIVFWVDETGQHGLVAASVDESTESTGFKWWSGSVDYVTNARGDGYYAGKLNTSIIISVHAAKNDIDNHAALVAANFKDGGFGDWYLPSKEELNLMYQNIGPGNLLKLGNIGNFASAFYWSSTEANNSGAWGHYFDSGGQGKGGKGNSGRVRAVRAF